MEKYVYNHDITMTCLRKQPMLFSNADILLMSRAYFILGTTVQAALYGFIFALYLICARSLYLRNKDRHRHHLSTLLYTSLIMALALCSTVWEILETYKLLMLIMLIIDHTGVMGTLWRFTHCYPLLLGVLH